VFQVGGTERVGDRREERVDAHRLVDLDVLGFVRDVEFDVEDAVVGL
jgi:hypothetical protein